MKILDYFQHIKLTSDQLNAVEKLDAFLKSEERVFILQGYAGSGKTTLLKGFVEYLGSLQKRHQLMAPTGRAAKVIYQKTGYKASTIHKGIYSFDKLEDKKQGKDKKGISFLYWYKLYDDSEAKNSIFLVDEASMISDIYNESEFFRCGSGHLLQDLMGYGKLHHSDAKSKIIFIGDPAQLPPIGMNFSPALSVEYIFKTYNLKASIVEMKEVKRQDENNGILISAIKIRQSLTSGHFNDFDLRENKRDIFNPKIQDFVETYKNQSSKKIMVCYKNKTASDLNKAYRKHKYGKNLPLQETDTVVISRNNYTLEIMNGEFAVIGEVGTSPITREVHFKVKGGGTAAVTLTWRRATLLISVEDNELKKVQGYFLENYLYSDSNIKPIEQRAIYLDFIYRHPNLKKGSMEFTKTLKNDKFFNCILMKYGYAVTCHKAQGGEWDNAFVFWDRGTQSSFDFYKSEHDRSGKTNADFYRWAYTAVTRASKKLYCVNPPYFNSFSKMIYIEPEIKQAFEELTDHKTESVEIEYDEVFPELEKYGLIDMPLTIQDHFIKTWYLLRKHSIEIVEWEKVNFEIRYRFKREDETASIKYWINGKHAFNKKTQIISSKTNSVALFDAISSILKSSIAISVNRNNVTSILNQIEFDINIEEERPFLKNLYNHIIENLHNEFAVSELKHLEFRERYTISSKKGDCEIDFIYDGDGFFGSVVPKEDKCSNPLILENIKEIIDNLN